MQCTTSLRFGICTINPWRRLARISPETFLFVDDSHTGAMPTGLYRRAQPRQAAADNDDVDVGYTRAHKVWSSWDVVEHNYWTDQKYDNT